MNRTREDSVLFLDYIEQSDTVVVDDDSDASSVTIDNDPDRSFFLDESGPETRQPTSTPFRIVDLTSGPEILSAEGDYLTDECFEWLLQDWGRLTAAAAASPANSDTPPGRHPIDHAWVDGIIYRPGQSLELEKGRYLRIMTVLQDAEGNIFFQGRHLMSTKNHKRTYMPKWVNELVWVVNESKEIPLADAKQFVTINFTNCCHVEHDFRKFSRPFDLFCRLKENLDPAQAAVEYLSFEDCDEDFRIRPAVLRMSWRGETRPFGDAEKDASRSPVIVLDEGTPVIDLTSQTTQSIAEQKMRRQYTFGDGFCGAGGVSSGAQKAGLYIKWAFDQSEQAIATYRMNFETALCEQSDIFSFLTNGPEFLKVDVSHGSPPCQTFSPAHTINSANDDANSACIFSCADMIKRCKPRVHTMEETSGLCDRHEDTFYCVIRDFIEVGYSVRWKKLNCMDYGVPQSRKRLVIIAAGPGEILPPFPRPSHGLPGSGLLEYTTINSVISKIPLNALDHDIEGARSRGLRNGFRAPFDPNQQAKTITCGGGDNNYHPSGMRGFTNREFACLQTFPLDHVFARQVRKQIGNAVPPALAWAIYREVINSLRCTDEEEVRSESI